MGSPASEAGRDTDEGPQRTVNIRAFAVSKFEITFARSDACVVGGGCGGYQPADQGWGRGNQPVINVSWGDVQSYITWINKRVSDQHYRLLSESEWEYAARAGTTTAYPWGGSASHDNANYGADTCCSGLVSGSDRWVDTAPVGSFAPNAFGLYDMLGNVQEWVQDCYLYGHAYALAPTDGSAAMPNDGCAAFALRGGSSMFTPAGLRSSARDWYPYFTRDPRVGFRIAKTVS